MPVDDAQRESLIRQIYGINDGDFETVALDVWRFQYDGNPLYKSFCDALSISPGKIKALHDIPFLPITMFRDHEVKTGEWNPVTVFKSSGTTGTRPGQHYIRDLHWYHRMAKKCFSAFYRSPEQYRWLALLPSYLERPDSSLVDMVQYFMQLNSAPENNFYSNPDQTLMHKLERLAEANIPTILIGVSFALLDLVEFNNFPTWNELLVIETGGMKGRREEITRIELHERLKRNHPTLRIASEYGMTELMSQAYSDHQVFTSGPTMKIFIRDISDPLKIMGAGQRGVINVIDLANLDTCAFIATDDIGLGHEDGSFEVLGRLDQSDIRGCNLMYN
jgi:phenylacetate-coenzyme A ligase PaaK-like adenylate-forming protein